MQRIMNAAFTLIARQGYESTSIAQIAAKAGVSKGLLYNYFTSKEDLLEKLIHHAAGEADGIMAGLMSDEPAVTLENIIRWLFRELRERPDYFRLLTELTFKIDKFEFMHDFAVIKYGGFVKFLEDLLQQINFPDAKGEARIIAALADGIGIQRVVIRENYPLDEMEEFIVNKYCKRKQI